MNQRLSGRAPLALGLVLTLGMALIPHAASAYNLRFLQEAPIAQFSEEDLKQFRAALREALETGADGTTTIWENPKTDSFGQITLLDTSEVQGQTCRRVKIFNKSRGRTGESTYRFCKQPDGQWKALTP